MNKIIDILEVNMFFKVITNVLSSFVYIFNQFKLKRDKKIILFEARFGETFADNSRFLYQCLYNNKNILCPTYVA